MTKHYKYSIACATLLLTFFVNTEAAVAFNFVYKDKTFKVDESIASSWKGIVRASEKNFLLKQPTPEEALAAYFGSSPRQNFSDNAYNIFKYRPDKIYTYLKELSEQINLQKNEPFLEIKNGRATNFAPPKNGVMVNLYDSTLAAIKALEKNQAAIELLVETDQPIGSLSETNNLGINELLAVGESNFKGSPKNRIHNIKVGLTKFKGIIIKPKEEFSFNKFLGPVEEEEGFLPELVIKSDGTTPELGGGLCQVSSTVFRAAMNAGLPITRRKNHSYAVQYYAPQGTDATIYPGAIDLKFINDTPGSLLVWPYIKNTYTLVYEFYGTKDARQITLINPVQYDRKEDGSMKAEWTRVVEKDGKTATSTFKSVYLSPALFHKEEKFVSATTTPQTGL